MFRISSIKWKQALNARIVRNDFITSNPTLISHIPKKELSSLVNDPISKLAYNAFWKRDLDSAQHLFRAMLYFRYWKTSDLKYIFLSLLPSQVFNKFIVFLDK